MKHFTHQSIGIKKLRMNLDYGLSLVLWSEHSVLVEAAKLVKVFLRRTNE